jgi:ribonuclease R
MRVLATRKTMAKRPGKSRGGFDAVSARDYVKSRVHQPLRTGQRPGRPDLRGKGDAPAGAGGAPGNDPGAAAAAGSALLRSLSAIPGGATASQLATSLKRGADTRDIAIQLRRLVEQGKVLEIRPGRYQVSGTGGEYAVVIEAGAPGEAALMARLPDGKRTAVNPRYSLAARPGDVAQAVLGEDAQALVTRILRRTGRQVVGTVQFKAGGPVLIPDNRREGELKVLTLFAKFHDLYQAGGRVVGTIEADASGAAGVNLTGMLSAESPEVTDFRYVCMAHDLPGEFTPEVETQARSHGTSVPPAGSRREDLRQRLIFTIDPLTAKDFDDAISLERDEQGRWLLGVHIADVSHYVTEHSPIDAEAACRSTSIYLINRVIPMLPEALSNGLCSLVPSQDRYCLSAFLTLDKQFRLVSTRLAETVIRSRHRFTYEQALEVLEERDPAGAWPEDVKGVMREVSLIAQGLRRAREKAGALNLFSVEHRFNLDVNGLPINVEREGTDISHQLIEECMLLANRAVAEWLESKRLPCVYRIHEQPDAERMKQFAHHLEAYGLDSSGVENRFGLQRILGRLAAEPPAARLVLNYLCLRSFKKAIYSIDNIGHYALSFASYAHFTSPIRRYPDLLVHRLVKRGLGLPEFATVEIRRGYLDALAKQASNLEQRAESAERDLQARKSARYLHARIGEEFPGVVTGASPGGLTVQLLETGMEGFVPLRELRDDFYNYDAERFCLAGRHSGRIIGPGEEMDIRVVAVDVERADVVLGLPEGEGDSRRFKRDQGRPGMPPSGQRQRGPERTPPGKKGGGGRAPVDDRRAQRLTKQEAKREDRKRRREEAKRKRH